MDKNIQKIITDLGDDITEEEIKHSNHMLSLLEGKKVIAARILYEKRKEVFIEFEDGTRLFVDNFNDKYDVSVTGGSEE